MVVNCIIKFVNEKYYETVAPAQLKAEEFKFLKEGNTSLDFKGFQISNDSPSLLCDFFLKKFQEEILKNLHNFSHSSIELVSERLL